ncbi:MarR family transcriptional regulator [Nocardioides panacihumi]|uniref:MarR family transcriptional regulator n=1 Tax=Nocardioides panacihumi TaxID=400774 RepID=A0ABN2RFU6_9ACTN
MSVAREQTADAFITASRALVGMAIRSIDSVGETVTVAQHRVLVVLAARGPQTIGDVASELAVNPSNATRHCERLSRLGLVTKQRSALDARIVEVSLSRQGKRLLDTVTDARRREVLAVLDRMEPAEAAAAIQALAAFSDTAREVHDADWVTTPW